MAIFLYRTALQPSVGFSSKNLSLSSYQRGPQLGSTCGFPGALAPPAHPAIVCPGSEEVSPLHSLLGARLNFGPRAASVSDSCCSSDTSGPSRSCGSQNTLISFSFPQSLQSVLRWAEQREHREALRRFVVRLSAQPHSYSFSSCSNRK